MFGNGASARRKPRSSGAAVPGGIVSYATLENRTRPKSWFVSARYSNGSVSRRRAPPMLADMSRTTTPLWPPRAIRTADDPGSRESQAAKRSVATSAAASTNRTAAVRRIGSVRFRTSKSGIPCRRISDRSPRSRAPPRPTAGRCRRGPAATTQAGLRRPPGPGCACA